MNPRVLVVEDDGPLRDLLGRGLREEGFSVVTAPDAAGAMRMAGPQCAALVLDVMLPDADGRDLCAALRAQGVIAPALFLTARGSVEDRLSGFAAGGDDYLTKPFHFAELVARLQVLIRRTPAGTTGPAVVSMDPVSHAVQTPGGSVRLTPTEFRLMSVLAAAPGAVVRRRELVRAGWPNGAIVHENTLDQYVARIRRKLRAVHAPVAVETAHGVGYRYVVTQS
jgi:two-component system response regulator MprA